MSTIGKLFRRSPFGSLQRHMEQVALCVAKMGESLEAFEQGRWGDLERLAGEVSQLEHQADQIKDDIRLHLRTKFYLAVDRNRLQQVLTLQDSLADVAEDVCVLLTYKQLEIPAGVRDKFQAFRNSNVEAFLLVECIIRELDELVQSGFGGAEAEKIRAMVHEVAVMEHTADTIQHDLLKALYANEAEMSYGSFYLWMRLTRELANLSNKSENLANGVQAMLELK